MSSPDWMEILREEVAKSNVTEVARQMGYARSTISLVVHGRYPGDPHKVAARVIEVFSDRRLCPHTQQTISAADCAETHSAPMPTSNAKRLRHWTACRACPFAQSTPERTPA